MRAMEHHLSSAPSDDRPHRASLDILVTIMVTMMERASPQINAACTTPRPDERILALSFGGVPALAGTARMKAPEEDGDRGDQSEHSHKERVDTCCGGLPNKRSVGKACPPDAAAAAENPSQT